MEYNLVNWFKEFSLRTWRRIELSQKSKHIRTSETTLTENLIFNLYLLSREFNLPIQIYEADNEKINGNDFEIALETKKGYVLLPTQAKKINTKNKYSKVSHKTDSTYQIDLLEKYANKIKGIPLYLFYNGFKENKLAPELKIKFSDDIKLYGCSISKSKHIRTYIKKKRWKIPKFEDIHPNYGIPLYRILDIVGKDLEDSTLFDSDIDIIKNSIKYYSEKEVIKQFKGFNLAERPSIGFIQSNEENETSLFNTLTSKNSYKPRYRIIISNNPNFNKFKIELVGF